MNNRSTGFLLAASFIISAFPFFYLGNNNCGDNELSGFARPGTHLKAHKVQDWKPKYQSDADESPAERYEWEMMRTADPATGVVPSNIRALELQFAKTIPKAEDVYEPLSFSKKASGWKSRGPYNVGGRTRALALDITNENTILAGGATGGMWRSTNGGKNWENTTLLEDLKSVSCLEQDKRPGKSNIWYYGTGEYTGGYIVSGDGIFKSVDSGKTWKQMHALNKPQIVQYTNYIWNIATDPSNLTEDEIYVAAYGGIYRSTDGGEKLNLVLGGGKFGQYSSSNDVVATSKGVVYATLSSNGPVEQRGLWRSEDGITWTRITPAGWPGNFSRVVMGVCPSNENVVYFLGSTPDNGAGGQNWDKSRTDWNSLWKYTYQSGDGAGDGGKWENRSANLPMFYQQDGHIMGDFSSQGGYDLVVKVKPDDENTVFIGGTILCRSTDGFTSTKNTSWIGGYQRTTHILQEYTYPNHHPDQHNLLFYPSNPNKILSAHDGGISRTDNCLAPEVKWEHLNNGYITTQFYSVALNPDPKHDHYHSDVIVGGLQDNQTWLTNIASPADAEWEKWTRGDGGHCAIIDNDTATFLYTAIQLGRIFKYTFDKKGNLLGWNRIDPAGAGGYLFINPYVLDASNSNKMYTVSGGYVWRNDNLASIPLLASNDTTSIGWTRMENSKVFSGQITAITSVPNALRTIYYGTNTGKLYRINNADNGDPQKEDISHTLFANRYISCVAADPKNAEKLLLTVSNYNVKSLFYSEDGGKNWVDISGNLEENPDGRGNGPSCRWAKIVNTQAGETVYYVGTSTGLYMTKKLDGLSTIWVHEAAGTIGNNMVEMIAAREKDGIIVAATYGTGIFSADLNYITSVKEKANPMAASLIKRLFPNPACEQATLELMLPKTETVSVTVTDINGKEVLHLPATKLSSGRAEMKLNLDGLKTGVYFCNIQSGNNISTKKFLVVK